MKSRRLVALALSFPTLSLTTLGCVASSGGAAPAPPVDSTATVVQLPGGEAGIGLDDLRFSPRLGRLVSPAGRTGNVDLVDPATLGVTPVGGFTAYDTFDGDDQQGVESADEGAGLVFAVDRASFELSVIDPAANAIVASKALERTEPDYVRYSAATSEVWITNPGHDRIEVLTVPSSGTPTPVHAAFIAVPGGVEGLTIDGTRMRAYTHNFSGSIAVVDMVSRTVIETWPTGCGASHGIPPIDEKRGLLFAGCGNAQTAVLDLDHGGKILDTYTLGTGRAIMAYAPTLRHFYLRGDPGTPVAMLAVSDAGKLTLLGTVQTTSKGHCMTADDRGNLWVCDWKDGRLLRFPDPYPPSSG